uniref:Uncharacterized protein n=1 Tax=viral metagenome TaxID=1070528 RepID=A0A6M3JFX2_9ZZZZ
MASLAELRQCCEELKIDCSEMTREDMENEIRTAFDKKYGRLKSYISIDKFSKTLLQFIIEEYDWVLKNKDGEVVALTDYKKGE